MYNLRKMGLLSNKTPSKVPMAGWGGEGGDQDMALLFRTACWRSLSRTQYCGSGTNKGLFQERGKLWETLGTVPQEEGIVVPPPHAHGVCAVHWPAHSYHAEPPLSWARTTSHKGVSVMLRGGEALPGPRGRGVAGSPARTSR